MTNFIDPMNCIVSLHLSQFRISEVKHTHQPEAVGCLVSGARGAVVRCLAGISAMVPEIFFQINCEQNKTKIIGHIGAKSMRPKLFNKTLFF